MRINYLPCESDESSVKSKKKKRREVEINEDGSVVYPFRCRIPQGYIIGTKLEYNWENRQFIIKIKEELLNIECFGDL